MKDTKQVIIPLSEYESMKRRIEHLEKSFDELESTKRYESLERVYQFTSREKMVIQSELAILKRKYELLKEISAKKKSFFNWF